MGCNDSNTKKQLSVHAHTHTHTHTHTMWFYRFNFIATILGLILLTVWLFKHKVTKSPFILGIFLQKSLCTIFQ